AAVRGGPVIETSPDARGVVYEHMTLWPAEGDRAIVCDLSVEVPQGQRLAITGASEATRAGLLATVGLVEEGQGGISRPGPGGVMFVPQRPCAASGRLRDVLLDGLDQEIGDDRLKEVLEELGLGKLIAREGGLEAERDWAKLLSPGELQALTFARLLL